VKARLVLLGLLFGAAPAFAANFAPSNMTSNVLPFPYVASSAGCVGGAAYLAFSGSAFSAWQGCDGGVDALQIALYYGVSQFSPNNMTSASTPSPFVVATSTNYNSSYAGQNAFDASTTDFWLATNGGVDWVSLDTGSGSLVIMGTYDVTASSTAGGGTPSTRAPKNWTMQGSNDNSTWTTVDTQTNQTSWTSALTRTYTCATQTTAYRYFRFNISANNGDATYTELGQLTFHIKVGSASAYAHSLGSYAVEQSTNGAEPLTRAPKNWTMQGSNDCTTWTTLDTQTNQTGWTTGLTRTYALGSLSAAYLCYRLNISANNGDGTWVTVGQLFLYDTGSLSATARHRLLIN
jgi:hypothetical protein